VPRVNYIFAQPGIGLPVTLAGEIKAAAGPA